MSDSSRSPRNMPTDAELAILRVLWAEGPCTVRQVHSRLGGEQNAGYTSILKFMQIMLGKGLVERDERERTHVYRARVPAAQTERRIVRDLLDRVFGGAADQLILRALSAKRISREELQKIRTVLDDMEKQK